MDLPGVKLAYADVKQARPKRATMACFLGELVLQLSALCDPKCHIVYEYIVRRNQAVSRRPCRLVSLASIPYNKMLARRLVGSPNSSATVHVSTCINGISSVVK